MITKLLKLVKRNRAEIILAVGVILISIISFSAGYITAKETGRPEIRFEQKN